LARSFPDGPAQGLGKEMQAGATAYFEFINSQGGVHGRQIKLTTLDDGYEPDSTIPESQGHCGPVYAVFRGLAEQPLITSKISPADGCSRPRCSRGGKPRDADLTALHYRVQCATVRDGSTPENVTAG
jgi:Periplasmic binding protein